MNATDRCIRRVRRGLVTRRFGRSFCVVSCVLLILAGGALLFLGNDAEASSPAWQSPTAWIVGAFLLSALIAAVFAIAMRPSRLQTATLIDEEFSLQERLSSAVSAGQTRASGEFVNALTADAEQIAEQVLSRHRTQWRPSAVAWLPVCGLVAVAIASLVAPMARDVEDGNRSVIDQAEIRQVRVVAKELQKKIATQRRDAETKGLEEAKALFEKLESDLDRLTQSEQLDRKQAMIQLNDLKRQLDERRERLGSGDEMRKMMSNLDGISKGDGEKIRKAIARGEFSKAEKMVRQLAEKLRSDDLDPQDREQIRRQAEQMSDQMKKAVEQHERQKKELQRQIDQAKRQGQNAEADRLQQQLDEQSAKDGQMEQMRQMAESMQEAADAMKDGQGDAAGEALDEMADQLEQMQSEMEELEDLDAAMSDLAQGKQQMRCDQCDGQGCSRCGGGSPGDKPGSGKNGQGAGGGERDEAEDDTNTYKTQVQGNVKKGKVVLMGKADGPNRIGATREAVKQAIESAIAREADPSENQSLPRTERQHARQYFDELRKH